MRYAAVLLCWLFYCAGGSAFAQHCRIEINHGYAVEMGSGTLIAKDAKYGLVLTASHVIDGTGEPVCSFSGEQTAYTGTIIGRQITNDLAALLIYAPKATPIRVGDVAPPKGSILEHAGFGASHQGFRKMRGKYTSDVSFDGGRSWNQMKWYAPARQGDSGGGVFYKNFLVSVISKSDEMTISEGTGLPVVRKFLTEVSARSQNCPPWQQQRRVATPTQRPTNGSEVSQLRSDIRELKILIQQNKPQNGTPGDAGPPGGNGPPGPPGPPGDPATVDYDKIRAMVIESLSSLPPIKVQHIGNEGQVFDEVDVRLGETLKLRFDTRQGDAGTGPN